MLTIPSKYAYIIGVLIFFIPWLILFLYRKDLRREMLFLGISVAILGTIPEYFLWTVDWWKPETITGTKVGIEDVLLGFTNGGIAAVLYETVFKKRLYKRRTDRNNYATLSCLLMAAFIASLSFWVFGFTSFVATSLGMIASGTLLVIYRKDLLINAIASGILMVLVSMPVYWIVEFFSPGWIEKTWLHDTLSGIMILDIPIEDLVFYFLTGLTVGPFYELWQGIRLRNISK